MGVFVCVGCGARGNVTPLVTIEPANHAHYFVALATGNSQHGVFACGCVYKKMVI